MSVLGFLFFLFGALCVLRLFSSLLVLVIFTMDTVDLVKLCDSLSLRDEATTVVISDAAQKRGEEMAVNCLMGKILTKRAIPKEVFIKNFPAIWKNVKESGSNIWRRMYFYSGLPLHKTVREFFY